MMLEESRVGVIALVSELADEGLPEYQAERKDLEMEDSNFWGTEEERVRRLEREKALEQLCLEERPEIIQQGLEAYRRDLPELIRQNKERQIVAYLGPRLVAIAPTYKKIYKQLRREGLANDANLVVTNVSSSVTYELITR